MDNNLSLLKAEAKKLVSLLDENETGLFTWHMFLNEIMVRIKTMYFGTGVQKPPDIDWSKPRIQCLACGYASYTGINDFIINPRDCLEHAVDVQAGIQNTQGFDSESYFDSIKNLPILSLLNILDNISSELGYDASFCSEYCDHSRIKIFIIKYIIIQRAK